jgi:hypothetical protein
VTFQAKSLRSHTLYLLIKRVNFLSNPCLSGFWCVGAAQLCQRLLDGEFGSFGHGKPLNGELLGALAISDASLNRIDVERRSIPGDAELAVQCANQRRRPLI